MGSRIAAASGIALLIGLVSGAVAQTPPPMNWSGFYIGGNVGYGWGKAASDLTSNFSILSGVQSNNPFTNNYASAGTHGAGLEGTIGGAQIGYNFTSPRWIIGFESDIQSGQKASSAISSAFNGTLCNAVAPQTCVPAFTPYGQVTGAQTSFIESKIDWFGTIRGRLGYLVTEDLIVYGTGGLAYGRVSVSTIDNVTVAVVQPNTPLIVSPGLGSTQISKTNIGFTLGAGMEGKFAAVLSPGWSWKVEYLYLDLGSLRTSTPFTLPNSNNGVFFGPFNGTVNTSTRFTDNILRVGLNYRLAP